MSVEELYTNIQMRLAAQRKRLARFPDDPDVQRTVGSLEIDKENVERQLYPERFLVAPEPEQEPEPKPAELSEDYVKEEKLPETAGCAELDTEARPRDVKKRPKSKD